MAEWVRALDWRPGCPGFESRCGNFASQVRQCISEETLKAVGPFYLVVSMTGEIKYCNLLWTPPLLEDNSKNNHVYNTQV